MKRLLLFLLLLILISCGQDKIDQVQNEIPFEISNLPLTEKIKRSCDVSYLTDLGMNEEEILFIQNIYKKNGYKSYWINDSTTIPLGDSVAEIMSKPYELGISAARKPLIKYNNDIQKELALTLGVARSTSDLKNGFVDLESKKLKARRLVGTDSTLAVIHTLKSHDSTDLRRSFLLYSPEDSTYRRLFNGLLDFVDRLPYDTSHFNVRSIRSDSSEAFTKAQKALTVKGYIYESEKKKIDSLYLDSVIKVFQLDNGLKPDGVIGKYTAKAMNESTAEKIHRIILTMEKIRNHHEYPTKYILINLPEYYLRFFEEDSLRSAHRIVIGKPENQTPELESKLNKIVVYPYWKVPYSISSKEILPILKYNVSYLAKNNYKVYRKDVLIDPYSVNWKQIRENSFPYQIIQDPGPKNSLGILKFDFYNTHSVYFHDTPAKSLFGTDVRAYSHGCMRTQNPIDLAKKILEYDSIPRKRNEMLPDSLDSLLARAENYEIKLIDRIPIYVIYQTVTADQHGMIVHIDIYDRDKAYLSAMIHP